MAKLIDICSTWLNKSVCVNVCVKFFFASFSSSSFLFVSVSACACVCVCFLSFWFIGLGLFVLCFFPSLSFKLQYSTVDRTSINSNSSNNVMNKVPRSTFFSIYSLSTRLIHMMYSSQYRIYYICVTVYLSEPK